MLGQEVAGMGVALGETGWCEELRGWLGDEAEGKEAGLEHGTGRLRGELRVRENQGGSGDSQRQSWAGATLETDVSRSSVPHLILAGSVSYLLLKTFPGHLF